VKLIVFGTGPHASVVIDIVRQMPSLELAGVVAKSNQDEPSRHQVVGYDDQIQALLESYCAGIIGIGSNNIRTKLASKITTQSSTFRFVNAVHPSSTIAVSAEIGPGTAVMAGAVINPNAIVGSHTIINSNSTVEHDCVIGDFSSVAPHACLAGGVKLGMGVTINTGANLVPGVSIGDRSVIGAGSTVLNDIPAGVLAYGCPARVIRSI
tara:strand:- start:263236 stop:263862 length:627 start_codon:yes stop_codon:yes gene_type:complete